MTRQEMFDKAVRGLRSQEFQQCVDPARWGLLGTCVYDDGSGSHCAWGWVDTSLSMFLDGTVRDLHSRGVGVAAKLSEVDLIWAGQLQQIHDGTTNPVQMERYLRTFAVKHNLTFPEE